MARGHKHHDCPTTSKTKRKFCSQPSQSEVDEGVIDDGVDTAEEQACEPFADADEPLSGPFPGGPHDPSVLKSFKSHVAAAIWFNKEREPLKLQNHSYKLTQWVFDEHVANHKFWSYIDGSRLRPLVNCSYVIGNRVVVSAFCERWQHETNTFHLPFGLSLVYVQALRQQLDHMHAHEVIWDPYRGHREAHPLLEITFYTGMLKCLDIVEPYYPDRVLRQFGRVQTIPHNPYTPSRVRRVSDSKSYKVVYEYFDGLWQRWRDHVLADANRSIPVKFSYDCTPEYLSWYQKITHPYVQHPDRMSAAVDSNEENHPLQRISRALCITHSIVDVGRDDAIRQPMRLYEAIESIQHILLGNQVQNTRTYQRRRHVQNNE